jgi:hypothetical protein
LLAEVNYESTKKIVEEFKKNKRWKLKGNRKQSSSSGKKKKKTKPHENFGVRNPSDPGFVTLPIRSKTTKKLAKQNKRVLVL